MIVRERKSNRERDCVRKESQRNIGRVNKVYERIDGDCERKIL